MMPWMPWIIGGSIALVWLLWASAPLLRRGASTDHTEVRGGTVTSIQEIALDAPPDRLAELYFRRLRRFGGYVFLSTRHTDHDSVVRGLYVIPFIRFGALRREEDRETLVVANALFSRHGGTLSFVRRAGKVRIELRAFRPRLPMLIYRYTQLPIHRAQCRSFLAWLASRKTA
jgi:hypothetical protein